MIGSMACGVEMERIDFVMPSRNQIGLVSVSFRDRTPEEILKAMKLAGLSWIEWGSDVHAPCENVEGLRRLAEMQAKYGVQCSSYGTYFKIGVTPMESLPAYIDAAKILGTRILRLWCGDRCGAEMTEEERQAFLPLCREAARIAEKKDAILCMECHKGTFTERPEDAVLLMQTVRSSHFRMYWQPFQWQSVQENIENAKAIAPFTEHIHVFHWKQDEKLPLSEATDEWRKYLSEFAMPHTLLLEFMPHDRLEELAAEAYALRIIIGEDI